MQTESCTPSKEELGFLSKSPLCSPSSLRPLSPLPQFRRPSMTQFGAARSSAREWESGWNVLKAETFLIVHSHRPYVTQPDHVTGLCCSRGKPKALSPPQSHSNPIMQATCLHNSMQTDRWKEEESNRQKNRHGDQELIIRGEPDGD